jgi:hypothetical protein
MPMVTVILLVIVIALLFALLMKTSKVGVPMLDSRLDAFEKAQERTSSILCQSGQATTARCEDPLLPRGIA